MFAPRYYARRYCADRYFPGGPSPASILAVYPDPLRSALVRKTTKPSPIMATVSRKG